MAGTSNLASWVSTQTASRGPRSAPTCSRWRCGQSTTTSSASGNRAVVANTSPGVAHGHVVAEHLGHPHQRAGEVDRAEDDQARRRRVRLEEHRHRLLVGLAAGAVAADGRGARRQRRLGVARARPAAGRDRPARRRARRPRRGAACRPRPAPSTTVDEDRRPMRRARRRAAPRSHRHSSGSRNRWTVPPQVRPDREGVVVAVAEGHDPPVAGGEHLQGLGHHRALDAAAGDRPDDLAVLAHRHGGARLARARALDVDDARQRHLLALPVPAVEVARRGPSPADHLGQRLERRASECPSTSSSTWGSAAAMPCASGAKPAAP